MAPERAYGVRDERLVQIVPRGRFGEGGDDRRPSPQAEQDPPGEHPSAEHREGEGDEGHRHHLLEEGGVKVRCRALDLVRQRDERPLLDRPLREVGIDRPVPGLVVHHDDVAEQRSMLKDEPYPRQGWRDVGVTSHMIIALARRLGRLGRQLAGYDEIVVDRITESLAKDGYRMQTLVSEIVECYPFLNRQVRDQRTANAK
mgnify:CR=1 FL=1